MVGVKSLPEHLNKGQTYLFGKSWQLSSGGPCASKELEVVPLP